MRFYPLISLAGLRFSPRLRPERQKNGPSGLVFNGKMNQSALSRIFFASFAIKQRSVGGSAPSLPPPGVRASFGQPHQPIAPGCRVNRPPGNEEKTARNFVIQDNSTKDVIFSIYGEKLTVLLLCCSCIRI